MSQRTTIITFLERAKKVHGEKYDYSKVDYKGVNKKVIIICSIHGEFDLRPKAHYDDKRGCPNCDNSGKSGFHKSKWHYEPKFLYLIEFFGNGERFLKFGVAKNGVKDRVTKGRIPYSYETLFEKKFKKGEEAKDKEDKLMEKYKPIPYSPELNFSGYTECLELGIKEHLLEELNKISTE